MEKKRISPFYWKKWLAITLERTHPARSEGGSLVLLGIGNPLNGDDAVGPEFVKTLTQALRQAGVEEEVISGDASSFFHHRLILIAANQSPENFTGLLRRISPQTVILVDAAWMNRKPGTICGLRWHEMTGFSASTHLQPPSVLAQFLMRELDCEVLMLGIQPQQLNFADPLSPLVRRALNRLADEWLVLLQRRK
ncbi:MULTISPECIES: hydrogenase 3 maturation endopeptidase HyCI [Anaerolinea]|uniref:hydrogenase 3 maturation endopeptidase HyCI n=1 Tax=Anaerolinea TaxID=233189 RepID=UPI00260B7867|nr:hydrogenase 3 maturation endopeptidase HyCI [Anaerolinea thermophila]